MHGGSSSIYMHRMVRVTNFQLWSTNWVKHPAIYNSLNSMFRKSKAVTLCQLYPCIWALCYCWREPLAMSHRFPGCELHCILWKTDGICIRLWGNLQYRYLAIHHCCLQLTIPFQFSQLKLNCIFDSTHSFVHWLDSAWSVAWIVIHHSISIWGVIEHNYRWCILIPTHMQCKTVHVNE